MVKRIVRRHIEDDSDGSTSRMYGDSAAESEAKSAGARHTVEAVGTINSRKATMLEGPRGHPTSSIKESKLGLANPAEGLVERQSVNVDPAPKEGEIEFTSATDDQARTS